MSNRLTLIVITCVVAVAVAAWLLSGGANNGGGKNDTVDNGTGNSETAPPTKSTPPPPKPIFAGWEKPTAVICLTGETHGYLEPCGCSELQSGGISRRADLFRQIDERGWPRTALDLGGTLKRNRLQSQIKLEALLDAVKQMGYAAVGLGKEELQLDPGYLLSLGTPDQIPLLGSNTVLFGSDDFEIPIRNQTVKVGDVSIGVVSIIGNSYKDEVVQQPPGNAGDVPDIDLRDPSTAIQQQLEKLGITSESKERPDLLVLLSYAKLDESRKLAGEFPQFDLIVSAGGREDPDGTPEEIGENKTMLVTVGHKGKHSGVIGYFPAAEQKLRFELIELDKIRFHETPAMREIMRRYQERLADERVADNMSRANHETGAGFVGAKVCGECHTKSYGKWSTTKHAQAYETLKVGRKGEEEGWIPRIHDPECLACHVTGWDPEQMFPYQSGFVNAETTPHLQGQQCENCHGPGSIHTNLEQQRIAGTIKPQNDELISWRKELHLDQAIAEKQLCNRCHDLDNSPNFEFAKYWKEVAHPGRD